MVLRVREMSEEREKLRPSIDQIQEKAENYDPKALEIMERKDQCFRGFLAGHLLESVFCPLTNYLLGNCYVGGEAGHEKEDERGS